VRCRRRRGYWDTSSEVNFEWKQVVEPVMEKYTESTDGSYIERKESAMVWHYRDADPDFGLWQAKELLDHLESVLVSQAVTVKRGAHVVEVKPQVNLS
jgi:trehalose 6-phosphate synthase/phosphatase